PAPHSAVTTIGGPGSAGATTTSDRPSYASIQASRAPDGDHCGPLTLRERLIMEGAIEGATARRRYCAACLPGHPASILVSSCPPPGLPFRARTRPDPVTRSGSRFSSTGGTPTAVAKASTAVTSPAS